MNDTEMYPGYITEFKKLRKGFKFETKKLNINLYFG